MYSKYDVMMKEIQLMSVKNWWEKTKLEWSLKEKYAFEVTMPRIDLFRMSIIIEDMEEENCAFTASDLAIILTEDFLEHIRSKNSMEQLYQILESKKAYIDDTISLNGESGNTYGSVTIKLDRKLVRRAEVFFADMEHSFPCHGYTVEKLLHILLCDYMKHYIVEPSKNLKYLKKWYA